MAVYTKLNQSKIEEILSNYDLGELKFLGRDMFFIMFPSENVFPDNVSFVYYANKEKFTRMVEFKKFTNFKSKNSLIISLDLCVFFLVFVVFFFIVLTISFIMGDLNVEPLI